MQSISENGVSPCCFETHNYNDYFVKELMTGFFRSITYTEVDGIIELAEGHAVQGKQDQFGRFMTIINNDFQYSFLGWIPSEEEAGKGITVIDRRQIYQGSPAPSSDYLHNLNSLDFFQQSYTVRDLDVS